MSRCLCPAGLLQFEDNGEQLDATALLLLQRIAGSFPAAARQLLQCGCEDQLRAARANRSPDIQQLIDATLSTLMSAPVSGPTTHAYDPTPTPLQLTGTAYTASQQYTTGVPVSQGSNMTQGQFGGIVRPLEHEFAGALGPRSVPSTPQHWRQSGSTRDTYTGLVSSIQGLPWDTAAPPSRPATASSVGSTRPQLTNAGRQQREQFAGSALARPPTAPGPDLPRRSHRRHTTEDAYRQQQVSYGQIVSQQQGFALGPHGGHMGSAAVAVVAAGQSLLDVAAQLPAKATDWLLQPVVLAPADEQRLFEQRMRLQHAQDPIHIALPALQVRSTSVQPVNLGPTLWYHRQPTHMADMQQGAVQGPRRSSQGLSGAVRVCLCCVAFLCRTCSMGLPRTCQHRPWSCSLVYW